MFSLCIITVMMISHKERNKETNNQYSLFAIPTTQGKFKNGRRKIGFIRLDLFGIVTSSPSNRVPATETDHLKSKSSEYIERETTNGIESTTRHDTTQHARFFQTKSVPNNYLLLLHVVVLVFLWTCLFWEFESYHPVFEPLIVTNLALFSILAGRKLIPGDLFVVATLEILGGQIISIALGRRERGHGDN